MPKMHLQRLKPKPLQGSPCHVLHINGHCGHAVMLWLMRQTFNWSFDWEIRGLVVRAWSLHADKKHYSTLSLSTQLYEGDPAMD